LTQSQDLGANKEQPECKQRPEGFTLIVRCGSIAGPKAQVVKREEWDFQALETPRDGAKVNDTVSCVSWIMLCGERQNQ